MSLPDFTNIFQVVFGIGLVIFVHELGHFLAARWCGARVEIFSLGFGPRLVGWQRGDTLFQIAAVPLGGFVKVAGEYHDGTTAKEPGTLSALNVPQRFLYYSGGVIMNVIFALVVLPLVMFAGMPARQPVIGVPEPGLAAWEAGMPAQSRVLSVNGEPILDFQHLVTAIAVNGKDPITLVVEPPGSAVSETYTLQPTYDEEDGVYRLGLPLGIDPNQKLNVVPDSPAVAAGLTSDDALVRVLGQPAGLRIERQLVRALMAGGPVGLEVRGPDGALRTAEVEPRTEALGVERIGVGAVPNRVAAVRTGGVAEPLVQALGIQADDVLLSVEGRDVFSLDTVEDALAGANEDGRLDLTVLRGGEPLALSAPLGADEDALRLLEDVALVTNENTTVVSITPDSPAAAAGLVDGDRVLVVDGRAVSTWDEMLEAIRAGIERERPLELVVEHSAEGVTLAERYAGAPTENVAVTLRGAPVDVPFYGVTLSAASMTLKADGMGEAISMGTRLTKRFLVDVWLQLKKMIFSDEISTKNLGGIISISVISYDTASQGLSKLFFFLALLSINLAIINLLPIPILDGGHLLFLLIEAVKGSPVSERTFGYSQVVGLVMIMSLMVYVTYMDVVRWLLPG